MLTQGRASQTRQRKRSTHRHYGFTKCEDHGKKGLWGWDEAKKIKGRKRHILVDSLGLILSLIVLPANIQDRAAAKSVLYGKQHFLPQLQTIYADGAYYGQKLAQNIHKKTGWQLVCVKRTIKDTFVPLPKRWIVERTFAWINQSRRLSKHYEQRVQSSEAMIYLAMIRLMLRRLIAQ